jgi:hypothetical protein
VSISYGGGIVVPKLVRLTEEDADVLRDLSQALGYSEATLVRWALRHYARYGVWRLGDVPRAVVPPSIQSLPPDLGPDGREVG